MWIVKRSVWFISCSSTCTKHSCCLAHGAKGECMCVRKLDQGSVLYSNVFLHMCTVLSGLSKYSDTGEPVRGSDSCLSHLSVLSDPLSHSFSILLRYLRAKCLAVLPAKQPKYRFWVICFHLSKNISASQQCVCSVTSYISLCKAYRKITQRA